VLDKVIVLELSRKKVGDSTDFSDCYTVILDYANSLSPLMDYVILVKTPMDIPQVCSSVASD